jgi:prepilin-type N-terminal cleavage/methylation domain-containing protein
MRRGTTLLELALVLVIAGLLLAIALPRLRGLDDSLAVDRAAWDIVAAHRRARMSAILQSRVLELTIAATDLTLRRRGDTTRIWRAEGPAANRVALAGPERILMFSPVGITVGLSNASFHLTRGSATRTVVVSRLGRVRIVP